MISMSNVWDRATEFVGDNLAALSRIAIIILVFAAAQDLMSQATEGAPPATKLAIQCVVLIVALISLFARLAVLAMAIDDRRSAGEALALAAGRLLAVIGVLIVMGIVFGLLILPLGVLPLIGGLDPAALQNMNADTFRALPGWVSATILIYSLVLVVVVLWVAARLSLVLAIVVQERVSVAALTRSWRRTHGLVLRILGVLVLLAIVAAVAGLAAKAVFGTVSRLIMGDAGPLSVSGVVTAIAVALVATIFSVIGDAFTGKLYLATRAREDGYEAGPEAISA
jgi:hypothetical protein